MSETKLETKDSQEETDILRTLENSLRDILSLILEHLSQLISCKEEKQDIENMIYDYNSLDQLIKIIYSTLEVLLKKFQSILTNKDENMQLPLSIEYLALEKMLQKYESECREHIKNEQQLSIYAENLESKLEEIDKKMKMGNQIREKENEQQSKEENELLLTKIMKLSNDKNKLEKQIDDLKLAKTKQDQQIIELQKKIEKQEAQMKQINLTKPKFSNPSESYYQASQKSFHLAKKNYGLNQPKYQTTQKLYNFDKQKNDNIFKQATKQFAQFEKQQSYSILNKTNSKLKRNQSESQLQQYINQQIMMNPKILNQKSQTLLSCSKNSIPIHLNSQYLMTSTKRNKSSQGQNSLSRDKYIMPAQKDSFLNNLAKQTKKYQLNKTASQGMNFSNINKHTALLQL